jgi:hypothetical protein
MTGLSSTPKPTPTLTVPGRTPIVQAESTSANKIKLSSLKFRLNRMILGYPGNLKED